ncbi:MAG TPA: UDP-N-acetylglucosamine 1-carboxyvinyltransferase [Pirellulales bacterium]|nr:UDP-N-acetylglucosamine 1-carboxyvinyltransferase [Pirellulales bacterium]
MDALRIHGGIPLRGEVTVSGSKNAALPIMAATLLAEGPVQLERVPRLRDVSTLSAVLSRLGVRVTRDEASRCRLETIDATPTRASYRLVRRMRASFCVLGPLLARRRMAIVALPGGCSIGHRPVDLHLAGLARLGAEIQLRRGYVIARANRLRGAEVNMIGPRGPTVTGTANVMCAASLARGATIIRGAACEPEVVDVANFLNSLGARISGMGTPTIEITGVDHLVQDDQTGAGDYRIVADRIEAATLLIAGAMTGGRVCVTGIVPDHLRSVQDVLHDAGLEVRTEKDRAELMAAEVIRGFAVTALPYPGIPTDLQPLLLALACRAQGRSTIGDDVFPDRWRHVAELARMGASIQRAGSLSIVDGVSSRAQQRRLIGVTVHASDLRAAAALVLAGLAARGTTIVTGVAHLERGYDGLDQKLNDLGARISRTGFPVPADDPLIV